MNKVIAIFFLLSFFVGFSQNKENSTVENELQITKDFDYKNSNSYFVYFKDFDRNKSYKQILELQKLILFDKELIDKKISKDIHYQLWQKINIKNCENDTLNLVLKTSPNYETSVFLISDSNVVQRKIGFSIKNDQLDFPESDNVLIVPFLPLQKKTILLSTEIWNKFDNAKALNVDLYSLENYQTKLLSEDHKYLEIFLVLCFLSGGLLIMMVYNLLLFFQSKNKTYLYYAAYLMFSMFTFIIIVDQFKLTFLGNYKCYFNLMLDTCYALSFLFYGLFVYSIINEKEQKFFKIPLYCYFVFLSVYIFFIHVSGLVNGYRLLHLNVYMAFLFRIISITFTLLFILRLLKHQKHSYLKYILYGNVFLVVSFILHIFSYFFLGGNPVNHFYNLVGVIIEVLFFT